MPAHFLPLFSTVTLARGPPLSSLVLPLSRGPSLSSSSSVWRNKQQIRGKSKQKSRAPRPIHGLLLLVVPTTQPESPRSRVLRGPTPPSPTITSRDAPRRHLPPRCSSSPPADPCAATSQPWVPTVENRGRSHAGTAHVDLSEAAMVGQLFGK
jgi:hypothetical protein